MRQPSRRTLLASASTALAVGAAGCVGGREQADEQPERTETSSLPSGLARAFEFLYGPADRQPVYRIARQPGKDGPGSSAPPTHLAEVGTPEWVVSATGGSTSRERGLVATGSFDVEADGEQYSAAGTRAGFDLYREGSGDEEQRLLATDGETLLSGTASWVKDALDGRAGDAATYLESTEGVLALLSALDIRGRGTLVDDEKALHEPFATAEVSAERLPERLLAHFHRTDSSVSYGLAGWYPETPDSAAADALASFMTSQLSMDDVSTEVLPKRGLVIARASKPYTSPEERPETVGTPRFHGYDAAANAVLLKFDRGEQLPVDRYEIEIEGSVYEGDWARGQETIGEGSVIAIDAAAVDPGDSLTVRYEAPEGSYATSHGTTVLRRLPFAVDFAPNERTATLRYVEGPPLAADRVSVVVVDDEGGETTRDPWSGEISGGDSVTLSDLPLEGHLVVEYDRPDGDSIPIGGGYLGPPGRFEFDYAGSERRLAITYPDVSERRENRYGPGVHRPEQEPLPAGDYVITLDGAAADRQWSAVGSDIAPGDTLTLEGVPVGTEVSVAWIDADGTRHVVAQTLTLPDVSFEFDYDAASDELTVTHGGGPAVDADELAVRVLAAEERIVEWEADGTVSPGDSLVVEDVDEEGHVVVTYGERHLDDVSVHRITNDE